MDEEISTLSTVSQRKSKAVAAESGNTSSPKIKKASGAYSAAKRYGWLDEIYTNIYDTDFHLENDSIIIHLARSNTQDLEIYKKNELR